MATNDRHALLSPPDSASSPAVSNVSSVTRNSSLPIPRSRRLQPGSQKEIALINYLDDKILRITRRHAKKFSNESQDRDDTPGYTRYDEFVADVEPLLDVVWISGTPTIQIPYLLSLAGQVCSYLDAFPFSTTFFPLVGKIDEAFATLLRPVDQGSSETSFLYPVSTTDKVRIKSLIEETRVAAVNAASSNGHASLQDVFELDTEDDDDDDDDEDEGDSMSTPLKLSKVYKYTLELLGDHLVGGLIPQYQQPVD